jgi:hypothetical protein
MSQLIHTAFSTLYPEKNTQYTFSLDYTGKFKAYGANVRKRGNHFDFRLGKEWKEVDESIVVGLYQELFVKVFKEPRDSINIDLYNNFIQSLHLAIPKTQEHPVLAASFSRVNDKYFHGMVERPNLRVLGPSRRQLGCYDFKTDTITISSIFLEHPEALDCIMHHEMLHKALKYKNTGGRSRHHTTEFRKKEKMFENNEQVEKQIHAIIRNTKRPKKQSLLQPILRAFFP